MRYRPEIDGLRALAIVPVVLFHAEVPIFSGGFVGVDVFFVISGYLITGIILEKHKQGQFSLLHFYERRARRILPALLCVFACAIPFAWTWMIPSQLQGFGESMLSSLTFLSNVYFWQDTGYFGQAAEELPLLHTWSLAVEEQYYLFYPLAFLALWRFGTKSLLIALSAVFVLSLALAEYASHAMPNAGFFLPPTRIWELLIGSILALYGRDRLTGIPVLNQVSSALGLLMVVAAVFAFDKHTPFPGLNALVPTLGAAAILAFATERTAVGRLLATKPVVGIGLISYSLYLWHQPVLALARIRLQEPLSDGIIFLLLAGSILASFLSWRFVERPFRSSRTTSVRQLVAATGGSTAVLAAICIVFWSTNGLQKQFEDRFGNLGHALAAAVATGGERAMFSDGACRFWVKTIDASFSERFARCAEKHGKAILVVGDSHAMDLYNALYLNDGYPFIVSVAKGGCRPDDLNADCPFADIQTFVRRNGTSIDTVLFTQSGSYFLDENNSVDLSAIAESAAYVASLSAGERLIWVGPQVETGIDLRRLHPKYGLEPHLDSTLVRGLEKADMAIDLQAKDNRDYVYFSKLDSVRYDHDRDFVMDGQYSYSDVDHWSTLGEQVFGKRLVQEMQKKGLLPTSP